MGDVIKDVASRAQKIKLLIFDVDGVLTTGYIAVGREGEAHKEFYAQDGMGISLARQLGIKTAIITGRESEMVRLRGNELKIDDICQGAMNKAVVLGKLVAKHGLTLSQVAYVGDDINDLPVMMQVGLACAVANAVPEVKERSHFVTVHAGGCGAVREVVELILKAQNLWDGVVASYCKPGDTQEIRQ